MSKEEFIKYCQDSYKEVFGDKYDEKRATESAEKILKANAEDVDKSKEAVDAIVSRTKAKIAASNKKMEEFDSSRPLMKLKMGDHKVVVNKVDDIEIDGKKTDLKFEGSDSVFKVVEAIKKHLNYEGEVKSFDATKDLPKWLLRYDGHDITVDSEDKVIVDGNPVDWTVKMTDPLQKVIDTIKEHFPAKKMTLNDSLTAIKDELFDAPSEVKEAFNSLINYFTKE